MIATAVGLVWPAATGAAEASPLPFANAGFESARLTGWTDWLKKPLAASARQCARVGQGGRSGRCVLSIRGTLRSPAFRWTKALRHLSFLAQGGRATVIFQTTAGRTLSAGQRLALSPRSLRRVSVQLPRTTGMVRLLIMNNLRSPLLVDDFRFSTVSAMPTPKPRSLLFVRKLNGPGRRLKGLVDMHTHPMAHLGFGGHVLHGAPDVDILLPAGTLYHAGANAWDTGNPFTKFKNCNIGDVRAKSIAEALSSCRATHGGMNADGNNCGNDIRRMFLDKMEKEGTNKPHGEIHPRGFPDFKDWPKYNDTQHQQMWVDWIKRAWEGGLRVMVALAVNSMTLSQGVAGNRPDDDKFTGDRQIDELKRMVDRHAWMQIAYTPADLRKIVGQDKLAVVIGSELDDIGDFAWSSRGLGFLGPLPPANPGIPRESAVAAEIQRLYDKGVRYIFPVHVIDNHFGGTAIYEDLFPAASKYHFGRWPDIGCAQPSDGITKRVSNNAPDDFEKVVAKALGFHVVGGAAENTPLPSCPQGVGFVNRRGLQPLGRFALTEMMKRGIMIDIDHMGQKTADETIEFTARTAGGAYPLASGHNGLRPGFETGKLIAGKQEIAKRCLAGAIGCVSTADVNEKTRTPAQYRAIAARGGVVGVGWGDAHAAAYLANVQSVLRLNPNLSINIGSDINGFANQPSNKGCNETCVTYSRAFPQLVTGSKHWDYNKDGVAHIGLFPDFLRHVETIGGATVVARLFDGAEGFARMWERARAVGRGMGANPLQGVPRDIVALHRQVGRYFQFALDFDHGGGDYRNLRTSRRDFVQCAQTCQREARCKAFTWLKSDGRCYLKSRVNRAVRRRGFVTGSKRARPLP